MEKLQIPVLKKTAYPVRFEEQERPAPVTFKEVACEVVCGLHLAAGVFMILFVDIADQLPLLLLAIAYCFLGATFFGIAASVGGDEECI